MACGFNLGYAGALNRRHHTELPPIRPTPPIRPIPKLTFRSSGSAGLPTAQPTMSVLDRQVHALVNVVVIPRSSKSLDILRTVHRVHHPMVRRPPAVAAVGVGGCRCPPYGEKESIGRSSRSVKPTRFASGPSTFGVDRPGLRAPDTPCKSKAQVVGIESGGTAIANPHVNTGRVS
jgi:hypothetical protein